MKNTTIMVLITLIFGLINIVPAIADTCAYLDSDGDCFTGSQEIMDARDLALLRTINCAWSNCQYTLDANGDGIVTMQDVDIIRDITILQTPAVDGVPSVINIELINGNTQVKITVTDSDGTPRSDIGVNIEVLEYPLIYDGSIYTDSDGKAIIDIPSELLTQTFTGKVYFDADTQKQIPYTENILLYTAPNNPPVIDPIADMTVDEGDLVTFAYTATDPDGDGLTFTFSSPLNSNGEWQTDSDSEGTYIIIVTVSDGSLEDSTTFTLTVNNKDSGGTPPSGGGGGGGSSSLTRCIPVLTPTGNFEIKGDVKVYFIENSCTGEITTFEEKIENKESVKANEISENKESQEEPSIPAVSPATGFAVTNLVKENPITTAAASIIILSLLGYGIYWLRR